MEDRRVSPIILSAVIVAAVLLLYFAAYFLLGNPGTITSFRGPVQHARFFPNPVCAEIFRPAAAIESVLWGRNVRSTYQTF